MACSRHLAMVDWEQHQWQRRVTATEHRWQSDTNMWGQPIFNTHVACHTEYVCQQCGAVRDEGTCICDEEEGARCPARVALLNELKARGVEAS